MASTLITGASKTAGTGSAITAGQMVIDMADKIYLLEPNAAPLYVLVSKLNKRVAINPAFNWLEDVLIPTWATLGATAASGTTGATYVLTGNVTEVLYFQVNDLIKFPRTGEVCLVTASDNTSPYTITAVRGWATTTNTALNLAEPFFKIGTAFTEGSLNDQLYTKSTITTQLTNYCQIFRKSVEISKTLANTELYGGADRPYQRKKKGIELMKEMERTFYFGEPKLDVTSTYGIRRASGGINYYLSTNSTDAGGSLTESEFEYFLRTVFRYGSNTRYLFCAPLIVSVVSLWAQGKLQMFPKDKTYGIAITQYLSPHGTVNLVKDVILENLGVISNVSYYGGYSFAVELDDVVYRYLQNRDIQMETDIQHPGDDLYKDQYICEVGMEFHQEQKHGKLYDVTG